MSEEQDKDVGLIFRSAEVDGVYVIHEPGDEHGQAMGTWPTLVALAQRILAQDAARRAGVVVAR